MMQLAARSFFTCFLTAGLCLTPALAGTEEFSCTGPFGRDASHDGLVKAFGAANVSQEQVFRGGDTVPMTVVFARDPDRRLIVQWRDGDERRGLDAVIIASPAWNVGGAAVGQPIAVVERLNGQPFKLTDFSGSDYDGQVSDWQGGKFAAALPGGCQVRATIGINDADLDAVQSLPHPEGISSDDEALRNADPRLYELTVSFPRTDDRK